MSPFQRILFQMTRPWVVIVYMCMLVILYLYADKPVAEYFASFGWRGQSVVLDGLSNIGIFEVWLVFFVVAALYFRYIRVNKLWEQRAWFMWFNIVFTGAICIVLKISLGRARPDLWLSDHIFGFYGFHLTPKYWSLPSGHTTTIMTLTFALSILFPRYVVMLVGFGIMIAVLRVLLVFHYMTDILFAAWLALIEVGLLYSLLQKRSWLPLVIRKK